MVSRETKRRLAELTRRRLKRDRGEASPCSAPRTDELKAILVPDGPDDGKGQARPRIEEITPGRVVERPEGGAYWLIERRLTELAPDCEPFLRRFAEILTSEAVILPEGTSPNLAAFVECDPRRVLYLDLETTGLAGQPLFLVGTMEFTGDDFLFRQFFARDYAEEGHLLADVADYTPQFDMLVTFNGKSFDIPFVRTRANVNRLKVPLPPSHFDLLHEARRRWTGLLPNCKLVTIEEYVCRRRRVDDIPSAEIPAAYHEFVHTADASKMRHVIHHNALDLLTMAEIALYMLTGKNDWT